MNSGQHFYRRIRLADELDYSAIALVEGASVGPSVWIEQCIHCSSLRFTILGDGDIRYSSGAFLSVVEEPCVGKTHETP